MPEGARYRILWVESGRSFADFQALIAPYDPLTYADRLVGKRLLMIAGKVDEVIPPSSARRSGMRPDDPQSGGTIAATTRPWASSCPPSA